MQSNLLQEVPAGFAGAMETINELPADVLTEMCHGVVDLLKYNSSQMDIGQILQKCHEAGYGFTHNDIQSASNALSFIYRRAAKHCISDLSPHLQKSMLWSLGAADLVVQIWADQCHALISEGSLPSYLTFGKLVDVHWKVGMAATSNTCKNMNIPFVTMVIKVADSSGQVTSRSFEMSISEFKNFSQQMRGVGSVLETV